jgi:hypothetical protein
MNRRDLAWEMLNDIPGVSCTKPEGALYLFPRLDPKVYPIEDDQQFILDFLQAEKVLLVQGTGFNWPHTDHFRVVFLPHTTRLAGSHQPPVALSGYSAAPAQCTPCPRRSAGGVLMVRLQTDNTVML